MKNTFIKVISLILCVALFTFAVGCGDGGNTAKLVKNAELSASSYAYGDYMGDYTLTDINGNTHTFSELLKEKKAIVLNFWFKDCDPCKMEFPYLQQAYNQYKDDIALLAINPVDLKENAVKKFVEEMGLTFPVVMGDEAWIEAMSIAGFPTTVVIDRYGKIAYSHMGSITNVENFNKIFEHFTADDYKQDSADSIGEIK